MKLFIVGMPGAGKSLLGKILSEFLDIPHFDTDDLIEKRVGRSISKIFSEKGEGFFRKMEREALLTCIGMETDMICSTGGGILENEKNRENLKDLKTIYIKKEIDDLLDHLIADDDKRPLLKGNTREELEVLYDERKQHFELFPSIRFEKRDTELEQLPSLLY